MTASEIAKRHKQLVKRSFERHIDLFLTARFSRYPEQSKLDTTLDEYKTFSASDDEWKLYLQSHQAKSFGGRFAGGSQTIGDLDQAITEWWDRNKESLLDYQAVHESLYCLSFQDLQVLFNATDNGLSCAYCHITEQSVQQLIRAGKLFTKRLRTRGSTFEFDCRVPQLGYAAGNVSLCCYWCNNAKTDEFDATEFQPMADAIAQVWQKRLADITPAQDLVRSSQVP